jgi:hypothetical protein
MNSRNGLIMMKSAYNSFLLEEYVWLPPLPGGQCFWLQIQRSRVHFVVLPDFLRSSETGTGSTQPREDNWGPSWIEK